jgi:hypothetical protein
MIKKVGVATVATMLIFAGCGSDSDSSDSTSDYTVTLRGENLINNTDTFAPKIGYFEIVGNSKSENNKAVVSKSKNGGKFSYLVVLKNEIYLNRLYSALNDGSESIILEYDFSSMNKNIEFDCKLNSISKEGHVNYTCNDISIENSTGSYDTNLTIVACNDTEDKCSVARIPILFKE